MIQLLQLCMNNIKFNKLDGRAGEILHGIKKLGEGIDIKRTGLGSDYSTQRNYLTGKTFPKKLHEVKTGNAKLSRLQRKTRRRNRNYKVERYNL